MIFEVRKAKNSILVHVFYTNSVRMPKSNLFIRVSVILTVNVSFYTNLRREKYISLPAKEKQSLINKKEINHSIKIINYF